MPMDGVLALVFIGLFMLLAKWADRQEKKKQAKFIEYFDRREK